ncbi:MAG: hypothetical protein L6W00_30210 [Lentisphaeria bacterium]|nr:MAG: hypothetical protein L6W00_30210 [Lentisphaeria bacterium]
MLILHLTDALPAGTRFADRQRNQLESWGAGALLAARGEAQIRLRLEQSLSSCRLYAVDTAGRRLGRSRFGREQGGVCFDAQVFSRYGTVFAYELIVSQEE